MGIANGSSNTWLVLLSSALADCLRATKTSTICIARALKKAQVWLICKAPDPPAWQRHVQGRATPQMGRNCAFLRLFDRNGLHSEGATRTDGIVVAHPVGLHLGRHPADQGGDLIRQDALAVHK